MVDQWDESRISNLVNVIAEKHVTPIFHGNFKAPLASDVEQFRFAAVQYVKKEIDLAHQIGAPIIVHGGCIVEPKKIAQAKQIAIENFVKSVRELALYAAGLDVSIYLENLSNYKYYRPFHYIFTYLEEYDYVLTRVGLENVYFFLDIGHANICQGDPAAVITKYGDRIKGISFSNNNGAQDQHFGINKGTLNCRAVVRAIVESDWKGLVAFEVRDQSTEKSVEDLLTVYRSVANERHGVDSLSSDVAGRRT